jgi:arginase
VSRGNTHNTLVLIGAPTSAGAYGPGQERAPEAFRRHGLVDLLRERGVLVRDAGDVPGAAWIDDESSPKAKNVETVAMVVRAVQERVAEAFSGNNNVLVLGGDCTVEIGTVAGASADGSSVALAYVDFDADLNTPDTGDGILDWMGVAHLLAIDGTDERLTRIGGHHPMLAPDAVALMAVDNVTAPEQKVVDRLGLRIEPLQAVRDDIDGVLGRTLAWAAGYDRLLIHLDIDVLDFERFPIAENTDLRGGLELSELATLLRRLCAAPNWRALTLTEVNPAHAPDETQAMAALIAMVTGAIVASKP